MSAVLRAASLYRAVALPAIGRAHARGGLVTVTPANAAFIHPTANDKVACRYLQAPYGNWGSSVGGLTVSTDRLRGTVNGQPLLHVERDAFHPVLCPGGITEEEAVKLEASTYADVHSPLCGMPATRLLLYRIDTDVLLRLVGGDWAVFDTPAGSFDPQLKTLAPNLDPAVVAPDARHEACRMDVDNEVLWYGIYKGGRPAALLPTVEHWVFDGVVVMRERTHKVYHYLRDLEGRADEHKITMAEALWDMSFEGSDENSAIADALSTSLLRNPVGTFGAWFHGLTEFERDFAGACLIEYQHSPSSNFDVVAAVTCAVEEIGRYRYYECIRDATLAAGTGVPVISHHACEADAPAIDPTAVPLTADKASLALYFCEMRAGQTYRNPALRQSLCGIANRMRPGHDWRFCEAATSVSTLVLFVDASGKEVDLSREGLASAAAAREAIKAEAAAGTLPSAGAYCPKLCVPDGILTDGVLKEATGEIRGSVAMFGASSGPVTVMSVIAHVNARTGSVCVPARQCSASVSGRRCENRTAVEGEEPLCWFHSVLACGPAVALSELFGGVSL